VRRFLLRSEECSKWAQTKIMKDSLLREEQKRRFEVISRVDANRCESLKVSLREISKTGEQVQLEAETVRRRQRGLKSSAEHSFRGVSKSSEVNVISAAVLVQAVEFSSVCLVASTHDATLLVELEKKAEEVSRDFELTARKLSRYKRRVEYLTRRLARSRAIKAACKDVSEGIDLEERIACELQRQTVTS